MCPAKKHEGQKARGTKTVGKKARTRETQPNGWLSVFNVDRPR